MTNPGTMELPLQIFFVIGEDLVGSLNGPYLSYIFSILKEYDMKGREVLPPGLL